MGGFKGEPLRQAEKLLFQGLVACSCGAAAATEALEVADAAAAATPAASSTDWPLQSLSITLSCRNEWEGFQYWGNKMEDKADQTAAIEVWDFQTLAKRRIFFFVSAK